MKSWQVKGCGHTFPLAFTLLGGTAIRIETYRTGAAVDDPLEREAARDTGDAMATVGRGLEGDGPAVATVRVPDVSNEGGPTVLEDVIHHGGRDRLAGR